MRALFGCLAVLLGAVSIALAARYGYKGADTLVDGVISAVVFGAVALCAFLFDASAVRLWFMGHRIGSVAVGLIAAAALVVTFTNSLGAIAARGDTTLAERTKAVDARKDDRAELARMTAERGAMKFVPATADAVSISREMVKAAERTRKAECGDGDPKQRGKNCRQRESEEADARTALTSAIANKAATDRATKLDADIRAVRKRLDGFEAVANPNPLGAALELMLGAGAAALTAWQQAIVAAVFELCLVGVMVIYELLGHGRQPMLQAGPVGVSPALEPEATTSAPAFAALPPPRKTGRRASKSSNGGNVKGFVRDHLFPAGDTERVDVKSLVHTYRTWCTRRGLAPIDLNSFLDEIEGLCRKLGIKIEVGDDQRVYCLGVKIETTSAASVH
jgi:hypothetical protein